MIWPCLCPGCWLPVVISLLLERKWDWLLGASCSLFFSLCCSFLVTKLRPTLWWPHGCKLPGSSVHGISQARMLEWVAIFFSRGSSQPRDQTRVPCVGRQDSLLLSHHWSICQLPWYLSIIIHWNRYYCAHLTRQEIEAQILSNPPWVIFLLTSQTGIWIHVSLTLNLLLFTEHLATKQVNPVNNLAKRMLNLLKKVNASAAQKQNLPLADWYISYKSDYVAHKVFPKGALCGSDVSKVWIILVLESYLTICH